jgi:hypothetical protein
LKFLLVIIVALAVLGGSVHPARAYLVAKPHSHSLTDVYKAQLKNYVHAKYVCNNGAHRQKWWSCKAVKWLGRNLNKTYRALHPVVIVHRELQSSPGYAPGCGSSCVNCESGGNPGAVSPDGKYWGLYQFDYGTWKAHGGIPSHYGSAGASEQHQVAARISYDAWPNC